MNVELVEVQDGWNVTLDGNLVVGIIKPEGNFGEDGYIETTVVVYNQDGEPKLTGLKRRDPFGGENDQWSYSCWPLGELLPEYAMAQRNKIKDSAALAIDG